jgi:predicted dehydrogenase
MTRVGVVGLGKMGISHLAIFNAHPRVEVAAICDSTKYILSVLDKYTGLKTYSDYDRMLAEAELDAVVIATPSKSHAPMVEKALERGVHVFCEKPLTLSPDDSERLATLAREHGLATQVGYHNRHVATFATMGALLRDGAIGDVTHVMGEAYGPVVLKPEGRTWRSKKGEGGGCLYDYAAHVINLINWYRGEPSGVGGTQLPQVFSAETDDAAFSSLYFPDGSTGQLSIYWSDESYRKMTTRITAWGKNGRMFADRQEIQVYLTGAAEAPPGYRQGWNVKYTTELTENGWYYLRGEEYSAQVDAFVEAVEGAATDSPYGFDGAAMTDRTIALIAADAEKGPSTLGTEGAGATAAANAGRRSRWRRR